jgi:hypothetical protein
VSGRDAPEAALLLRLEARRLTDPLRNPNPATLASIGIPAVLAAGALWMGGESVRPEVEDGQGAILLGLLVAGIAAFQAYPVLFRPSDDGFLRRLGLPARALYGVRALRLLALTLVTVAALLIPYLATGVPLLLPLAVAAAGGIVGWGAACFALAGAAWRIADPAAAPGMFGRTIPLAPGLRDAAPLVFAPLGPLVAGAFAARMVLLPALPPALWLALCAAAGGALALAGAARFERALPRFAPQAGEMAYAPPPEAGEVGLVIGRGVAALLPARAGAVRARDAAVAARRFRGATRLAWPVAIVGALAVLRAGGDPQVRSWVVAAGAVALAAQGAALVGVGRLERGGPRWIDRAVGASLADRLLGRWAAGFGMGLAVAVPVGLAWAIGVPGGGAWGWPAAAAGVSLVASGASLAAAGRGG